MNDDMIPFGIGLAVFAVVIIVLFLAMCDIFKKAGRSPWLNLVPIYNEIVRLQIAGYSGWWILLLFIPYVGALVYCVMLAIGLAKQFGKGGGFAIGLIFLPIIFLPILGFGSAQYIGKQQE